MKTKQSFDAIVVGTGPGGSTVAKELASKGMKTLMLEWGKASPLKGTLSQMLTMGAIPGKSLKITDLLMPVIRGITLGGSSSLCYATALPPPIDLFRRYNIDLSEELNDVLLELPVAPLNDELIGPMARRIMAAAKTAGYNWQKLDKIINQTLCRPSCWRCSYGCPYGAKWNAGQFADQAIKEGAELMTEAHVESVLVKNNHAYGVEYIASGKRHKAIGGKVILAAGGLGSPVILMNSGVNNVGQSLFVDPVIAVMGQIGDLETLPGEMPGSEVPMAAGMNNHQEGYMLADMTLPPALFRAFSAQAGRFDNLFSHVKTLTMMVKARDSLAGSINKKGRLIKPLSNDDQQKLMTGYKNAHNILSVAGAKKIHKSRCFAAHPGGTVKINQSVDSNLQTDISNLYVCDSSVLPEDWGLPPVLTLICLGKRLAKHLC